MAKSIQALVRQKLKKSASHHKVMAKTRTIVLRPSMKTSHRRFAGARRAGGFLRGKLGGFKPTLDEGAKALGYGTIAVAAYSKLQPNGNMQTAQIVGLAGEYYGGGLKGVLIAEVIKAAAGVPSILSGFNLGNILGGGQQQQQMNLGGGSALL